MKTRLIWTLILLVILLPALIFPELSLFFQVMMALLSIGATNELLKALDKQHKANLFARILIYTSTILLFFASLNEWTNFFNYQISKNKVFLIQINLLPALVIVFLLIASLMIFFPEIDGFDVGKFLYIIIFSSISFSSLTILRAAGSRYIVYLFIISACTDIFAYLGGTFFGKHKLCPRISPNKTWEGALIGSFVGITAGSLFGIFYSDWFSPNETGTILSLVISDSLISYHWQVILIIFISISLCILAQLGDLVASRFKRTYEIKDFGNIIPGHGGIMDRLDSALFSAMFLLGIFSFINYLSLSLV